MVKKVELHNHLEGTTPPELILQLASRNNKSVSTDIISKDGQHFVWRDFLDFLSVFDQAANAITIPQDYYDLTYDYLRRCAQQDGIYVELAYSPDHAEKVSGIPSDEHLAAVSEAITHAERDFDIIGRIICIAVRHFGVEACEKVAEHCLKSPHPHLVGFGLGGDEQGFPAHLFERTYQIAREAGLGCTAHAGEMAGPESVIAALDFLKVTRIGHGVRSIEDPNLMARLKDEGIHLELCPTSNIALNVFDNYAAHPLKTFYDFGLSISLNSDDPPYFKSTLGGEYDIAQTEFGFNQDMLNHVSHMAIDACFADIDTKKKLHARVDA